MEPQAQMLFEMIDQELQRTTKEICNRLVVEYREMPWKADHYKSLPPLIRHDLDSLLQGILGLFDNIGSVLPEGYHGWNICTKQDKNDIRDNYDDYADMWLKFLISKHNDLP